MGHFCSHINYILRKMQANNTVVTTRHWFQKHGMREWEYLKHS